MEFRRFYLRAIPTWAMPAALLLACCAGLDPGASKPGAPNPNLLKTAVEIHGNTATYRCHYHNGVVASEITLVSGLPEGPFAIRFSDSTKSAECRYKTGRKSGEYVTYHRNGQRSGIVVFVEDSLRRDSKLAFDSLGRQISEWIPAGGDPNSGTYLIRKNGRVTDSTRYVKGLEEGWRFSLNAKGDTVAKFLHHSGKLDTINNHWQEPPGTGRSTEDILRVIRQQTPNLRRRYNEYLRTSRFNAKVTVNFAILRDGSIGYIFPLGDSSHRPRFVRDILNEMQGWRFSAVTVEDPDTKDIITVPFTFSE